MQGRDQSHTYRSPGVPLYLGKTSFSQCRMKCNISFSGMTTRHTEAIISSPLGKKVGRVRKIAKLRLLRAVKVDSLWPLIWRKVYDRDFQEFSGRKMTAYQVCIQSRTPICANSIDQNLAIRPIWSICRQVGRLASARTPRSKS